MVNMVAVVPLIPVTTYVGKLPTIDRDIFCFAEEWHSALS